MSRCLEACGQIRTRGSMVPSMPDLVLGKPMPLYFFVKFFAVTIVEQLFEPVVSPEPKVIIAVNADLKRIFEFLLVEMRPA